MNQLKIIEYKYNLNNIYIPNSMQSELSRYSSQPKQSSQLQQQQPNPVQSTIPSVLLKQPNKQFHRIRSKTINSKYKTIESKQQDDKKMGSTNNRSKNQSYKYTTSHTLLKPFVLNPNHKNIKSNKSIEQINGQIAHYRSKHSSSLSNSNPYDGKIIGQLRSKAMSINLIKPTTQSLHVKSSPYDKFVKEMNIRLPTPKQKFIQFMQIPPFNRLKNHTEFISHILKQSFDFFRMHPQQIIEGIAKKIMEIPPRDIPTNYTIILNEGIAYYNGNLLEKGALICRNNFQKEKFSYEEEISLFGLPFHQYFSFVNQYLNNNLKIFKKFIESIQIFKIFSDLAMEKMYSSLTLHFFKKGESLYEPGDLANDLFVIYSGSAARKIIVQIDKTNKIPLQRYSKLIKVLSRSYEHRIRFEPEDLVGVADIVDNIPNRSQSIVIDENATILAIDRNAIEQNLDEYIIDRLKKYNLRKYPKNYDQLCQNYLKQKLQNRKAQERKIAALKDEMNKDNYNERKNEKIHSIIKMYEERIKLQEKQHLIDKRKMERIISNDI